MFFHRAVVLFVFLSFTTSLLAVRSFANIPNAYLYAAIVCPIAIVSYLANKKRNSLTRNFDFLDAVPICFVIIWMYGVFVGLVMKNDTGYIFRNFSGMLMYAFFYAMLTSRLQASHLVRLILLAGNITLGISLLLYVIVNGVGVDFRGTVFEVVLFNKLVTGGDEGAGTRLLYVSQLLIFPLFCFHSFQLFNNFGKISNYQKWHASAVIILIVFVIFVVIRSKAFYLGFFVYSAWVLICVFSKKHRFMWGALSCLSAIFLILLSPSVLAVFSDAYASIFAGDGRGNLVRSSAMTYIFEDIQIGGNGLGAEIGGYLRSEETPYTTEVVYLNLVHKLGIVAVPLGALYWLSLHRLNKISKKFSQSAEIFSLYGLLSFLIYSVGNPLLLSSLAVCMHLSVNYCIRVIDHRAKL